MADIAQSLEDSLHRAFVFARLNRHQYISAEALLASLIDDVIARPVLIACGANVEDLAGRVDIFLKENVPTVSGEGEIDPKPNEEFQRILRRATLHVDSLKKKSTKTEVDGANALMAMYGEKASHAVYYLHQQGVTRIDVANWIAGQVQHRPPLQSAEEPLLVRQQDPIQMAVESAQPSATRPTNNSTTGLRVFISYSHNDIQCLNRLLVHLRPLERRNLVDAWSDKKIRVGDKWKTEIEQKLCDSAVAVLLVSADFLASDFIVNEELSPLLLRAEAQGLRIIPVILKPCGFLRDNLLSSFQATNDPAKPLLGMSEIEQELLYDRIASEIHDEILLRGEALTRQR